MSVMGMGKTSSKKPLKFCVHCKTETCENAKSELQNFILELDEYIEELAEKYANKSTGYHCFGAAVQKLESVRSKVTEEN